MAKNPYGLRLLNLCPQTPVCNTLKLHQFVEHLAQLKHFLPVLDTSSNPQIADLRFWFANRFLTANICGKKIEIYHKSVKQKQRWDVSLQNMGCFVATILHQNNLESWKKIFVSWIVLWYLKMYIHNTTPHFWFSKACVLCKWCVKMLSLFFYSTNGINFWAVGGVLQNFFKIYEPS